MNVDTSYCEGGAWKVPRQHPVLGSLHKELGGGSLDVFLCDVILVVAACHQESLDSLVIVIVAAAVVVSAHYQRREVTEVARLGVLRDSVLCPKSPSSDEHGVPKVDDTGRTATLESVSHGTSLTLPVTIFHQLSSGSNFWWTIFQAEQI